MFPLKANLFKGFLFLAYAMLEL